MGGRIRPPWAETAAFGVLLHFGIAVVAAGVYYAASRRLSILLRRPVLSGLLYGVVVYGFMNHVVVPLPPVPKRPFVLDFALVPLVVHMLCVGLPIGLLVRRHSI